MRKLFKLDKRSKPRSNTWQKAELDGTEVQISPQKQNRTGSALSGNTAVENSPNFVDPNRGSAKAFQEDEAKSWQHGSGGSSTQNVTTHEGFGSWLSTFQPEAMSSGEHQKNLERLSKSSLIDARGQMPAPEPLISPKVLPDPAPPHGLSHKAPQNCTIVFEGFQESGKIRSTDISLPPDTPLTSIIQTLQDQGFKKILGFSPHTARELAIAPWINKSNAYTIRVTSGPSNYSFAHGYSINEHESFISFFNASIAKSDPIDIIKTADDELSVDGGKLKISFQRSLRIPETGKTYDLPPEIAKFPLFNVNDFAKRMPGNMAAKGGVCMPLFQREAMWIDFNYPGKGDPGGLSPQYAIKVFVGGVNAISGETWNSSAKKKQDYIVVPPQPWLDGIATGPGVVKQFVAMPLGSGYSIEQQVTGKEDIGGIQMELSPVYNNKFEVSAQCKYNYLDRGTSYGYGPPPSSWSNYSTPKMMACTVGMRIFIKDYRHGDISRDFNSQGIYYDLPVDMAWGDSSMGSSFDSPFVRPAVLRDLLDLSPQEHNLQKPLFVTALNVLSIFVEQDGSLEYPPQAIFVVECSPFATTPQLIQAIEKASSKKHWYTNADYKVQCNGVDMDERLTIWEHGIRNGAKVKYFCLSYVQPQISEIYTPAKDSSSGYYETPNPGGYPYSPYVPVSQPIPQTQPPGQQPPQAYSPFPPAGYSGAAYYPPPPQQPPSSGPPAQTAHYPYQPTQQSSPSPYPYSTPPQNQMGGQNPAPNYAPMPQTCPQPSASCPGATYSSPPKPQYQSCSAPAQTTEYTYQPTQSTYLPTQGSSSAYPCAASPPNRMEGQNLAPSYASAPPTAHSAPSYSQSCAPPSFPPPQQQQQEEPRWDMGLAAGGRISQKIHPDPLPKNSYNTKNARVLNIQILNSVAFETCTGMLTPETPITTESYAKAGLPFYRIYEEEGAGVYGFSGDGDGGIKSLGTIDQEVGVLADVKVDPRRPTVCLRCNGRLVDCILRKCNHAFCAECVRGKMTTREGIVCAFCGRVAELLVGISAPMSMPGEDDVVLTNVVVLQESKVVEIG